MHNTTRNIAIALSFSLSALTSTIACANVAAGCAAPAAKSGHNTFYIDPVHGSMSGDGSKTHPWHTLGEVLDVRNRLVANAPETYINGVGLIKKNPNGPIKSGDTIFLMSGNHGNVFMQGNFGGNNDSLYGYNNDDFVNIIAAPNQTPIIKQLSLKGVNKWLFQGLTFESLQDVPGNKGQPFSNKVAGLGDYDLATLYGPNSNIIFSDNTFQSQSDTSAWTVSDWIAKRVSGLVAVGTTCLSVTNNKFQNIGFAVGVQRGSNVLIQHNVIDHFTDDGIDYGSDNMVIDGNQITNNIADGDGFHADGMQGQPYGDIPVKNIQITNNYVNNQTMSLVSPGNLQGIDTFDGVWQNIFVENNVVITNAYHGITFYGVQGIAIINNTVIASADPNTWININPSKSGSASGMAIVRNNIATFFAINASPASVDHNMVATANPNTIKYFKASDGVPTAVLISSVFKTIKPSAYQIDPRLLDSKAVAGGSSMLAPPTDIRGLSRGHGGSVDLGALTYGGSAIVLQNQTGNMVSAN